MIFTINYFLSSLAVECMQKDTLITLNAINTFMYMYLFALIHPHNTCTQYNYAVSLVDNAMGVVEGSFVVVIGSFYFCNYIISCL